MKKNKIKTLKVINFICFLIFIALIFDGNIIYSQEHTKKQIQINGKFKNVKSPAFICLYENDLKGFILLDSVPLVKSGKFSFVIDTDETKFLILRTAKNDIIKLIASTDDSIFIEGLYDNLPSTFIVKGSYDSELLKQIDQKVFESNNKVKQLGDYFAQSSGKDNIEKIKDSLDSEFNNILNGLKFYLGNIIKDNPRSLACLSAINQSFGKNQVFTLENDDSLFSKLSGTLIKSYPNNKHALAFSENVEGYLKFKREYNAIESRAGISVNAPDIILLDKDSNRVSLSDFKGKIVLLKFWNPSCDVCREENLKLIPLQQKYKEYGFEVFEVSIGTKKEEWIFVINEDKTDLWTNVKIPEEGDNIPNLSSYYVWLYGVKSVPYSFLINKEGVIVNKGFKPDDLDEMLQELLNKK